jgi:hypothetical protein
MPTTIDETQARKALRHLQIRARWQWQRDGQRWDLAEYEDAGMAAITGCLARFDPRYGTQFQHYAAYRINGAVRDAPATYRAWRHGVKVGPWKQAPPNAKVLRPRQGAQPDPVLRSWLLRQVPALARCDGVLLRQVLAGTELQEIAEAEGVAYITVYKRYRHLLRTLKRQLAGRTHDEHPGGIPTGCHQGDA